MCDDDDESDDDDDEREKEHHIQLAEQSFDAVCPVEFTREVEGAVNKNLRSARMSGERTRRGRDGKARYNGSSHNNDLQPGEYYQKLATDLHAIQVGAKNIKAMYAPGVVAGARRRELVAETRYRHLRAAWFMSEKSVYRVCMLLSVVWCSMWLYISFICIDESLFRYLALFWGTVNAEKIVIVPRKPAFAGLLSYELAAFLASSMQPFCLAILPVLSSYSATTACLALLGIFYKHKRMRWLPLFVADAAFSTWTVINYLRRRRWPFSMSASKSRFKKQYTVCATGTKDYQMRVIFDERLDLIWTVYKTKLSTTAGGNQAAREVFNVALGWVPDKESDEYSKYRVVSAVVPEPIALARAATADDDEDPVVDVEAAGPQAGEAEEPHADHSAPLAPRHLSPTEKVAAEALAQPAEVIAQMYRRHKIPFGDASSQLELANVLFGTDLPEGLPECTGVPLLNAVRRVSKTTTGDLSTLPDIWIEVAIAEIVMEDEPELHDLLTAQMLARNKDREDTASDFSSAAQDDADDDEEKDAEGEDASEEDAADPPAVTQTAKRQRKANPLDAVTQKMIDDSTYDHIIVPVSDGDPVHLSRDAVAALSGREASVLLARAGKAKSGSKVAVIQRLWTSFDPALACSSSSAAAQHSSSSASSSAAIDPATASTPIASRYPRLSAGLVNKIHRTKHSAITVDNVEYSRSEILSMSAAKLKQLCAAAALTCGGNKEAKMERLWMAPGIQIAYARARALLDAHWEYDFSSTTRATHQPRAYDPRKPLSPFHVALSDKAPWLVAYKKHFASIDKLDFFLARAENHLRCGSYKQRLLDRIHMIIISNAHSHYRELWEQSNPGVVPRLAGADKFLEAMYTIFIRRANAANN
jgi:hypothetical protein